MNGKMKQFLNAQSGQGPGMPAPRPAGPPPWTQRPMYEYKVIEIREKMIGGKMSGPKLERLLNENAALGWQLKAITAADVSGRIGPGGVEGLLVTFERLRG